MYQTIVQIEDNKGDNYKLLKCIAVCYIQEKLFNNYEMALTPTNYILDLMAMHEQLHF